MTKHNFSFKDIFMFGWVKTKQHAWFVALTLIIAGVVISSVKMVPLLDGIVSIMVGISLASISLVIARDHSFTFNDLFTPLLSQKRVLKFIALTVLYVIPVILTAFAFALVPVGLMGRSAAVAISGVVLGVLLFVPSLYAAVRFKFFPFVVIENENASLEELIKMSYKITANHFWPIFVFLLLVGILNLIGAMLFLVGLFVTIPVSLFAAAHVYLKLKEHSI